MSGWFKLQHEFYDHPKFVKLTPGAVGVWVMSMAYCNTYLTDGFVPSEVAYRFAKDNGNLIEELVVMGLWRPATGGWKFHDWHEWNPTRAEVEERRRRDAARKRDGRSESAGRSQDSKGFRTERPRNRVYREVNRGESVRADSAPKSKDSKESYEGAGARDGAPPALRHEPVDREHQRRMAAATLGPLREELAAKRRAKLADNGDE